MYWYTTSLQYKIKTLNFCLLKFVFPSYSSFGGKCNKNEFRKYKIMKGDRKISPKWKLTDNSVYKENEVKAVEK